MIYIDPVTKEIKGDPEQIARLTQIPDKSTTYKELSIRYLEELVSCPESARLPEIESMAQELIILRQKIVNVRTALLIITNYQQCSDNTLSDKEIARIALEGLDA